MKLQDFSNELRKDPYFVIAELQLKLEEANARIAEPEAQTRWIPVGERLPEEGERVLVVSDDEKGVLHFVEIATFSVIHGWLVELDDAWIMLPNVTHWMPLPKPPEAQND